MTERTTMSRWETAIIVVFCGTAGWFIAEIDRIWLGWLVAAAIGLAANLVIRAMRFAQRHRASG